MSSVEISPRNRLQLVLISSFLLRLLLQTHTSLPDFLSGSVEVSTPITSFKKRSIASFFILMVVKEGLLLYEYGVPPYNGAVCHQVYDIAKASANLQAPLLLVVFSILRRIVPSASELTISLVFALADILSAWFLTMLVVDEKEKWKIAASYVISCFMI